MFSAIYKRLIVDYAKITLSLISLVVIYFLYHSKDFNLDASSDALLLEVDMDLKIFLF